ncbi:MAG: pirin family protein [Cyclobacteriaceae bacterium]
MNYQIFRKRDQASGAFDGGKILENKPIGFPHEGGLLKPYSNIFYWAHAWSDTGGLIDMHPHQGFEIMSFVLKGTIEHFDTKNEKWIQLHEGDAQIIRAGKGISHAEKFLPGSHIFQIWVDPDLSKTLKKPASYDDYSSGSFHVIEKEGYKAKIYRGEKGKMEMDAVGLEFKELLLEPGIHELKVEDGFSHANYLIKGRLQIENEELAADDFFQVMDGSYSLEVVEGTTLFQAIVPNSLDYQTYAEMQGIAG